MALAGEGWIATEISSGSVRASGSGVAISATGSSSTGLGASFRGFLDVVGVVEEGLVTRADLELKDRVDWLRVEAAPALRRVVGILALLVLAIDRKVKMRRRWG